MARKLKTFTTSAGFFDLAVAAPSMKAALDAWGAGRNLFRDGFAKVADDPEVVAATMARPGVVLRRPVGSEVPYSEQAALPESLPAGKRRRRPRAAAEGDPGRQEDRTRKEKEREARDARAIAAARGALEKAARRHKARVADIETAWAALERRLKAEEARWRKHKRKLESALRQARS